MRDVVELARDLVAIPSVSGEEAAVVDFVDEGGRPWLAMISGTKQEPAYSRWVIATAMKVEKVVRAVRDVKDIIMKVARVVKAA